MEAIVLKWGNSLAVRLPRQVAVAARLQQGDRIRLEVGDKGTVQIRRAFPTLDELVAQITPENRYSENEVGIGEPSDRKSLNGKGFARSRLGRCHLFRFRSASR
jgi:antitoxin MazE